MRLFVGIPLSEAAGAELSRLTSRLRTAEGQSGLRWSKPESWHITLQFLGNVSEEQFSCLVERLGEVRGAPFTVLLGRLGVFARAGVFHAEAELSPHLVALQQRITAATAGCGFEADERPYRPHITLARGRKLHGFKVRIRDARTLPSFRATEFLLYESHLSSAGSSYEIRRRFPLTGSK